MEKVTIELTVNEVNAIRQMLHFAVQARGMEVAEAAVVLNRKLGDALESQEKMTVAQPTAPSVIPPSLQNSHINRQKAG